MNQGNIGLFENNKTGERAWLWKLHSPTEKRPFYINLLTKETYKEQDVESFKVDSLDKEWTILRELNANETAACFAFTQPNIYVPCRSLRALAGVVKNLKEEKDKAFCKFSDYVKKSSAARKMYEDLRDKYDAANKRFQEALDGKTESFCYVHAKHHATDAVDWCWYADPELAKTIHPGDTIAVDTSRGRALAVVTSLEYSNEFFNHKCVLENLTYHEEENDGRAEADAVPEAGENP